MAFFKKRYLAAMMIMGMKMKRDKNRRNKGRDRIKSLTRI